MSRRPGTTDHSRTTRQFVDPQYRAVDDVVRTRAMRDVTAPCAWTPDSTIGLRSLETTDVSPIDFEGRPH
jgi:hypothetical protein